MSDKHARILEAAHALFETHGVAATSRREVAHDAGVATRSVTAFADSRSELLALVTANLPFPPT